MLALAELCGERYESLDEAVSLVVDVLVWRVQLRATWGSRASKGTWEAAHRGYQSSNRGGRQTFQREDEAGGLVAMATT